MISSGKRTVLYSIDKYLDITANWIYYQFREIKDFDICILAQFKENIDLFPHEHIYAVSDLGKFRRLLERIEKKLRGELTYPFRRKVARKIKPALIHSHFGTRGFADLELKEELNVPLITSFYGMDATMIPKQFPEWRERYKDLFRKGDLFLVESGNMKRILSELGCDPAKITIQSLGVSLEQIKLQPRQYRPEGIRILIASSFREKKGIPDSLAAIANMKDSLGQFTVTIIGGAVDLPDSKEEEQKIQETIDQYQLRDHVKMPGFMKHDDLIRESYNHDIFFATSKTARSGDNEGGTNIVILEMAASGLPVLATDHCDFSYAVGPENRKYLAEEGNVESICASFRELIKTDWQQIAETNRRHIEANFDVYNQARKLEGIYHSLL